MTILEKVIDILPGLLMMLLWLNGLLHLRLSPRFKTHYEDTTYLGKTELHLFQVSLQLA